jgi:hypothetical protein
MVEISYREEVFDQLKQEVADKQLLIDRLVKRVATKDNEFALERAQWKRKDREREAKIRDLGKQIREMSRAK